MDVTKLAVSTGTRVLDASESRQRFYVPDAVVPRKPWRSLDADELSSLITRDVEFQPLAHVGLARIDGEALENLQHLLDTVSYHPGICSSTSATVARIVNELEDSIVNRFHGRGATLSQGLKNNAPRLETLAIDRSVGGLAGLHIDAWDGVTSEERERARIRVTVALGPEPRYFLLVNLSPLQMIAMLKEQCGIEPAPERVWLEFAKAFPDYPVLRIALSAGDAYVAATDYLVHDGSTEDAARRTFSVQIRGHFRVN